ncbi:hypothetical protein D3C72_230360 [compost metagenome]
MLIDADELRRLIRGRIHNLEAIGSELSEQLALIDLAAKGEPVERDLVLRATALILDNLYRGLLSPRMTVPKDFWHSPLGLAIARAHAQVIRDDEVMSQADAAHALGVSREYISQLVESGKVATVVREASAPRSRKQPREMIFRSAIDHLRSLERRARQREEGMLEGRP